MKCKNCDKNLTDKNHTIIKKEICDECYLWLKEYCENHTYEKWLYHKKQIGGELK